MAGSLVRSTGIVALSTMLSRITGFIRDMIIASCFGASGLLDGFFVAFRIPNLFRRLVGEGALTISFIPVYTDYLVNMGEKDALELAQKTLTILVIALFAIVGLGVIFSEQIIAVFAYGFTDPHTIELTVALNRVMFPYLFLVGIVAFAMGVLNSHGYFFAPAFSTVLLNAGFIIGALLLGGYFSEPIFGLAIGVIIGGVMQVLLQIPDLRKTGFRVKVSLDLRHPGIRRIFRMLAPATFGIAVYQINILMSTLLASMLPEGSISYLFFSDRLTEIVLGVFIVSIGNVILPAMSRESARDDLAKLRDIYRQSMSAALFLSIPSSIALMTIGLPIVSVLFMRGQFTAFNALMTERALFYSSMGISSIAILRITTPAFYSLKDTKTPVISSAVAFVVNIACGYVLMRTPLRHAGLALGNTIASTVQVLILLAFLNRKIGISGRTGAATHALKCLAGGLVMGAIIYGLSTFVDWTSDPLSKRLPHLVMLVTAGAFSYFAACYVLHVPQAHYLVSRISSLVRRARG